MSVGILKRLLTILNVAAVLGLAGTAYGFWTHRTAMEQAFRPPNFNAPPKARSSAYARIDSTMIQLGIFPQEKTADTGPKPEEAEIKVETEIAKLGTIKGAIVVYEPYQGSLRPAIIFEYKPGMVPPGLSPQDNIVSISLGEGLVSRPDPNPELAKWGDRVPVRFKFIRCEPDTEHPGWTYFVFDIHCDGKKVDRARWKGETTTEGLPTASPDGPKDPTASAVVRDADWREKLKARKPRTPAGTNQPRTQPVPPTPRTNEFTGSLFEENRGTREPTQAGIDYLRDNHQKLLKDAFTAPYDQGGQKGIKIRRFAGKAKGLANQFGIMEDDVILSINGIRVGSKTQAVSVVKRELQKKPAVRYIEVKLLRLGATKTLRFDARDPETRRKARDAFRNR